MDPGPREGPATASVDVISSVGTWLAAVIALVALVGIVAPWLTLRAAHSEKNRALNEVEDEEHRFISRGIAFGRYVRLFRRVRVPELAPNYGTNAPDDGALLSPEAAGRCLAFEAPEYSSWNMGWASFAAVCEAFHVLEDDEQRSKFDRGENVTLKRMLIPTGGTVDVVNSRAAIVVSRYWILLLGLLGRYSSAEPADTKQNQPISGAPVFRGPESESIDSISSSDSTSASEDDWAERPNRNRRPSYSTTFSPDIEPPVYRVFRGRHGGWKLSSRPEPQISGFTGTLRSLGQHQSSWSQQSLVTFYPRIAAEPGDALGVRAWRKRKSEVAPLRAHFWLANGYIPQVQTDCDEAYDIFATRNPLGHGLGRRAPDHLTSEGVSRRIPENLHFILKKDKNLPLHVFTSAAAVNSGTWRVFRWAVDPDNGSGTKTWYDVPWASPEIKLLKRDVSTALNCFFRLAWDEWGYLTRRSECQVWSGILKIAENLLGHRSGISVFLESIEFPGFEKGIPVLDWALGRGYLAAKTREYVLFERAVESQITEDSRWLRVPIAVLFLTSRALEHSVYTVLNSSCTSGGRRPDPEVPMGDSEIPLPADGVAADLPTPSIGNSETAKGKESKKTPDGEDADNGEKLSTTSFSLNSTEDGNRKPLQRQTCREFRYVVEGATKSLVWIFVLSDRREVTEKVPFLSGEPFMTTNVDIALKDIVLIALWAATRCALWLSSDDSGPLMEFVEGLDRHVWVT